MRTSNAGAADVQELTLSDGRRVWQHVARLVASWGEDLVGERGLSSVGAVVGATVPRAVGEARRLLPQSVLLLPGVGAQGATPADVARAFTSGPASALVTASRSVIYAYRGGERRLARGRRRRGRAAALRRLGGLGLVNAPAHPTLTRYAAPIAFLAAVTVAVLLVRAGLSERTDGAAGTRDDGRRHDRETTPATTTAPATTARRRRASTRSRPATRSRRSPPSSTRRVEQLLVLNPDVDPVALGIGERIRVK